MINKDHINLLNRRSIKQHKDFLDNEYKEIIINVLKNCINKSEEEILEHISWYKQFLVYNNLKNKYINTINIININVRVVNFKITFISK
ncbi:hypothetical protein C923_00627 [Plasmodium falciparum UGT5.1]|uniref:Uncharacterized protein n=1 Tax=Plasmodium falciparum UGT5.1 TaxID=1237627 RepID=W7K421_PLAFA|nr:hypothetical protein C923_00627 [Plasmodium falciparum UGT5.1]